MAQNEQHIHTLRGSCSCGRNQFAIDLPDHDASAAKVILDNSAASRRAHASPLTAYLLIPLPYYRSATFAFYPDETHRDIRRTYNVPTSSTMITTHTDPSGNSTTTTTTTTTSNTSLLTESQQRHFCGYCGTHFSSWSASPVVPGSEEYMRVSLESIADEDFGVLYALGLLEEDGEEEEVDVVMGGDRVIDGTRREPSHTGGGGREWFEKMLGGSRVAEVRGWGRSENGTTDMSDEGTGAKRKFES